MLKPSPILLLAYKQILPKYNCHQLRSIDGIIRYMSNNKSRSIYAYGTLKQSPMERISEVKILSNMKSLNFTYRIINNIKIAIDCSQIALRYSKCYMCRLPFIRYPLRQYYHAHHNDSKIEEVYKLFLAQCPIPKGRDIFHRFHYQNKGIYAALSMLISRNDISNEQYDQMVKFMASLELINLGFALHHSIGKSHRLNLVTRIALKLISKQMKDSYLVLGGDYFHIRGSVLAAETGLVQLSELLSQVQIDLCKYVHLIDDLKQKIKIDGYSKVEISEIYNISLLKTSPLVKGFMAMDIIQEKDSIKVKQAYQCLGLLVLYRRDLQNFIFNFKQIIKKYTEYITNRISFDLKQSLPYYIFFQGINNSKNSGRIDLAYLNTVKMMSEEISYLENRVRQILGEKESQNIMNKMDYYLMIYSK